jgi:hypothetical protein
MENIRHIAASFNNDIVAFGEFEQNIQIMDITKNIIISEFKTILDFGGRRLIISLDGNICVCGCYKRYGICGYNVKSGEKIWQRKDLKKVQNMQLIRSNNNLFFVSFDGKASEIIEIATGKSVKKILNCKGYYENRFLPLYVLDGPKNIRIFEINTNKNLFNIRRQSFATLDMCFSENTILISESTCPLNCYDIVKEKLLWQTIKTEGEHFLRISYNNEIKKYIGVTWPYKNGGNKKLKYINCDSGKTEHEMDINCPTETEFGFNGKILITSDKEIIDIQTGKKSKLI